MKTNINGSNYDIPSNKQITALDFLRNLGITGPKKVCNAGACGACSIQVDGKVINSCVTPVQYLAGKTVLTVESVSNKKNKLHPIQIAFMENDGMQCGFCTPGFIVEAKSFYEKWKKENGTKTPTQQQVASALAGHLCRCAAYPNIYKAVQLACSGKYDKQSSVGDYPRYDAKEKVTGQAIYTFDTYFDDELIGYIYRSPHANAVVKKANFADLEKIDGVEAVVSMLPSSMTVRYVGKEIFAAAVTTEDALERLLGELKIEYEIKDSVFDPTLALQKGSPLVYETKRGIHDSSEGFMIPGKWGHNTREAVTFSSVKGSKAEKLLDEAKKAKSEYLIERTYSTSDQVHTALEPHICVAKYDNSTSTLDVYLSTQGVHAMADVISKKVDIPLENIEVHAEYVGGGFGSKLSLTEEAIAACKLSIKTGKPVRVEYSREEELTVGGIRPAADMEVKILADENGLKAFSIDCYSYSGVGAGYVSAPFVKHVYGKAPRTLRDVEVFTNKPPSKPFRAPGASRIFYALESAVDDVAVKINKDPIDLRLEWELHENKIELLKLAKETELWKKRSPSISEGRYKKGVGVGAAIWPYWYEAFVEVELVAESTGITAKTSIQDIGTGSRSVVRDAVVEGLGVPKEIVKVEIGHSNLPKGITSGGSMTTPSTYYAVLKACKKLKATINDEFKTKDISEALQKLKEPLVVKEKRGSDGFLKNNITNALLGLESSANVVVTEVEVDTLVNKIQVKNVWSGVSAGKIVSPKLAENQVFGGVMQGIGYALFEKKIMDQKTGRVLTASMEKYKIPTLADTPNIEVYFHQEGFNHVKGGAVGLAEVVTIPVAASVANAVFNATGVKPTSLPITMETYEPSN